ncbi:MAG: glycosyltransferase [Bacteroidia bacterium]|nr:glycosyltransferase [Bacteroidia bacterium]
MRLSIIIPSYNQFQFIEATLKNIAELKELAKEIGVELEVILFDNQSNQPVQDILKKYSHLFDVLKIEPDKGQYDAINKGITLVTGDYWTWLNTDDLIDKKGITEIITCLKTSKPDYIYGDIETIDEYGNSLSMNTSGHFSLYSLTHQDASISQPGSFFKTKFTKEIGLLSAYKFAFDYEYILRILKNNGNVVKINAVVAQFRYYTLSKSGSRNPQFLIEQQQIAKKYGGSRFSRLNILLTLRIIKRKLF